MYRDATKRAERGDPAQELDRLQFAAKLQFKYVAQRNIVSHAHRQRLQFGVVFPAQRRPQPPHGECNFWRRSIRDLMLE